MSSTTAPTFGRMSRGAASTGARGIRLPSRPAHIPARLPSRLPLVPSRPAVILASVVGLLAAGSGPVAAQSPRLSLELRGGAALPVGSFQEGGSLGEPVASGASFGARFVYRTAPTTALQFGFSQDRAACETCPGGSPYVATLWDAGVRFGLGLRDVHSWILLGMVVGRVERDLAVDGEPTSALSSLDAGGAVGIGIDAPIGGTLRIAPAVRWVGLNTRFPDRDLLRMRYAVLDLGVMVGF